MSVLVDVLRAAVDIILGSFTVWRHAAIIPFVKVTQSCAAALWVSFISLSLSLSLLMWITHPKYSTPL